MHVKIHISNLTIRLQRMQSRSLGQFLISINHQTHFHCIRNLKLKSQKQIILLKSNYFCLEQREKQNT